MIPRLQFGEIAWPSDSVLLTELQTRYRGLEGAALLRPLITREFAGRIAVLASFGAESVVLLDLVARIDPATPVIFLDTGMHFPETLAYRDRVIARLGLKDVRSVRPSPLDVEAEDPDGTLSRRDPDRCCYLRKVLPLEEALSGFDAWITGRKRFHGAEREGLGAFELVDGKIKVNPLTGWSTSDIARALATRDLPRHPLVAQGYGSIGCAPCTGKTPAGGRVRSGRWAGRGKTECGIHKAPEQVGSTA
jgi:phosphoadenosine phosphosulfate reductase